eukprot:scaffold8136_cov127-Cylindrotheca_fusiformis.AAC.11
MRCLQQLSSILLFIIISVQFLDISYAFERNTRRGFGLPRWWGRTPALPSVAAATTTTPQEAESSDDHINNNNFSRRRKLIVSSAAALTSAILGGGGKPSAEASTTLILEENEQRRIDTFEKCAPSVVFIDTFAEKKDAFSPNSMEVPIGSGSGFVWDKEGHIGTYVEEDNLCVYVYVCVCVTVVTNYHVVRNAKSAQVAIITPNSKAPKGVVTLAKQEEPSPEAEETFDVFSSPSELQLASRKSFSPNYRRSVYKAKVVGIDPGKDIAVLKVEVENPSILYPIAVGSSKGEFDNDNRTNFGNTYVVPYNATLLLVGLKVGQLALAIGNPFGLDHTLTAGIISGLGREVKSPIGRPITNVIQTDAAIVSIYIVMLSTCP